MEAALLIETFLHSITQKYTLHTHPTVVNILAATESGWTTLKDLFPNAFFKNGMCDGVFLTREYTYDAMILKDWHLQKLSELKNVEI